MSTTKSEILQVLPVSTIPSGSAISSTIYQVTGVGGASLGGPMWQGWVPGSDVPITAGTFQELWHNNSQVLAGSWNVFMWGQLWLALGATPPSALLVRFQFYGGGGIPSQFNVPAALLVANANLFIPVSVSTDWNTGNASNALGLQVSPTGQNVTAKAYGTALNMAWSQHP